MLRLLCKALLLSLRFPSPSLAAEASDATCADGSGRCGASAGSYYWPTQKGTASRTGFSPYPVPDIRKPPTWSWNDPYWDTIRATPLIDDKLNVYLSTTAGRIYKWNKDGMMLWKRDMPFGTQVVGCLYDGKFITATKAGLVVAIDMETGMDRWQAPVSPINRTQGDTASMLAHDGLIISATHSRSAPDVGGNSDVVAVRAEDGAFVWRYHPDINTFNFQGSAPGDGTIVFQDLAGGLYRLNLTDGSEIWKSGKRGWPWSASFTTGAAVCHEGKVFVVSNTGGNHLDPATGFLHVYRLEDGVPLWEHHLPYSANQAVAIGPHPTQKGKSIAVLGMGQNPGNPALLVSSQTGNQWLPPRLVHFIDLYFGWVFVKNPAAMRAYDTETGAQLWHYELPPFRMFSTKGDSERVVRRIMDLGVNPHNDAICLPDSCSQPVIGPDGTSYTGWQDGKVYAIRDANGDGQIDDSEVATHEFTDGFQGSMGMAPGLFAAAPCGGGIYVWRS